MKKYIAFIVMLVVLSCVGWFASLGEDRQQYMLQEIFFGTFGQSDHIMVSPATFPEKNPPTDAQRRASGRHTNPKQSQGD